MKTFMIRFGDDTETNIEADYYRVEEGIALFFKITKYGWWNNETDTVARILYWKLIKEI